VSNSQDVHGDPPAGANTVDERTPRLYDSIGVGYERVRTTDPRIERLIHTAVGPAHRIVNVGAGSGSYEPPDRFVVGVEPSIEMLSKRPHDRGPALRGVAAALPFRDAAFDAGLALLTVHHWPDPLAGLAELRRVTAGPVVVFTFDKPVHEQQWLVTDYLPEMAQLDRALPSPSEIAQVLGGGTVEVVPVPADCLDGFCHAWWRRPEAYLDPRVRAGISGIARLPAEIVERAVSRLADDLASGAWLEANEALLGETAIDAGYRLVVANR
jgi:SAM-dependent methyltransferase